MVVHTTLLQSKWIARGGDRRYFRSFSACSLRLAAQDVALSRRKQGFESPRERKWFQQLSGIKAVGLGAISNFSPMDVAFRRSVRGHPVIVRSRRPEEIGAVTVEPALVLAYKDDHARIAARSAEQIESPDALLCGAARSEQWYCWIGRGRIISTSAENAAIPASASILPRSWH
jgi:hypothetical protein